ncbi:uncharacterized protein [Montipora capricornis]|uniref:uncharacterized protein isoform X1 n=1 Tax=Montipora capricornis TaxID=246305 RepID=UPI0035F1C6DB
MKAALVGPLFLSVLVFLPNGVSTNICHRLKLSLFQRCIKLGYNYTARFPEKLTIQESIIGNHLERDTKQFEQCSEHLDTIMCAMFVPKCVEERYGPILPCRWICEDFVRDCEPKVEFEKLEWVKGLCPLLPSSKSECFEPTDYKPRDTSIPVLQNCTKLQMSSCSYLGYSHTTQGQQMQFILENVLRRKLKTFQNNSALCLSTLKKIYCAEFAPPCFPEDKEDIVLRTVCKRDCEDVKRKCPEVYKEHFGDHAYCEQLANEKSDLKGFCKLTKWPTAVRWPSRPEHVRTAAPVPTTPTTISSSSAPSSVSYDLSPVPLAEVPTSSIGIIVFFVVTTMLIIGIATVLTFVKRQGLDTQGRIALGYLHHVNESGQTTLTVSLS